MASVANKTKSDAQRIRTRKNKIKQIEKELRLHPMTANDKQKMKRLEELKKQ